MGIYPDYGKTPESYTPAGSSWTETRSTPGLVEERIVFATNWAVKERTNCYCCSCADLGGSDPYCRNHNYGYGMRPCDRHNMPGETKEDPETGKDLGVMPDSVQVHQDKVEQLKTRPACRYRQTPSDPTLQDPTKEKR